MTKDNSRKNLDKKPKKNSKWKLAIGDFEKRLLETKDKDKRDLLRGMIRFFKRMDELGEPWPGESKKRRSSGNQS